MVDDVDPKEYRWETGYEKTWEIIQEDDDGRLDGALQMLIDKAKRRRQNEKAKQNRLGIMRYLYVTIDCSESMSVPDLKPTRMLCTLKLLEIFIKEFFDQNPLSQIGLIVLKGNRAEKLTELTGTSKLHVNALQELVKIKPAGEPSLQNGLNMAMHTLKVMPSHASREILIIISSLSTCDPSDICKTINELKREGIRCSVICLAAEVHVFRHLTQQTNGSYSCPLDDAHFRDQLMAHIDPPVASQTQENSLIKMGFPHEKASEGKDPPLSMCMCHIKNTDEPSKLTTGGFNCPQCLSKYCELPVECVICGLTLVSAPHLARSYHHLFPVARFTQLDFNAQAAACYACQKTLTQAANKHVYRCETCSQIYCIDCDIFIHDVLHSCQGCNTIPGIAASLQSRQPQSNNSEYLHRF